MALVSDTFDSDLSLWNQYDLVGDCTFGISNGIATISIPSDGLNGGQHNLWTSDTSAPRLEQGCEDGDLDVVVEILDVPNGGSNANKYTGFGMLVSDSTRNNFVRVDLNGSISNFLFGATIAGGVGGTATTRFNIPSPITTAPYLFRIRRTKATNTWTISYSTDDGATWTTPSGGTFTYSMTASIVAIAVNNANSLAVTGRFGRFTNLLAAATTAVATSRAMTWRVRKAVTPKRVGTWRVRVNVAESRAVTWRARIMLSAKRAASWRLRKAVASQRATLWQVRKAVQAKRTALWRVLTQIPATPVQALRAMSWRVRETVGAQRSVSWRVRQGVAVSRSATWRVRMTLTVAGTALWRVRTSVIVERALSWAVKVKHAPKAIVITFGSPVSKWAFGRIGSRWNFGTPKSDGRD